MELRQLEYFVAVVEEAGFTRAATRLHVAQPGVSAQIRRLERELGEPLLDRSGRTVRLTEVGAAVLPYARAALGAVAGARDAVAEFTGLVRGQVNVGMVSSVSTHELDLVGLLAGFHQRHPAVEMTVSADGSGRLLHDLQAGRLDVAFVGRATAPPPGIDIHVVVDERLVALVAHDDPLAAAGRPSTIELTKLADRTLIGLPRGTGLRACVDGAFAQAGLRPRMSFEADDPRVLADLAARGLGVAILPESLRTGREAQLRAIEITPAARGRLAFAWRPDGASSPATRRFVAHVRATLAARAGEPVSRRRSRS
jgi:DNA-binding transcriptional LysR family regulator